MTVAEDNGQTVAEHIEANCDPEEEDPFFQPGHEFYQPLGADDIDTADPFGDGIDEGDRDEYRTTTRTSEQSNAAVNVQEEPLCFSVAADDVHIPEENIKVIQDVMKQIQIPETCVPDWAKRIPEEQWLPKLKIELREELRRNADEAVDPAGTDLFAGRH